MDAVVIGSKCARSTQACSLHSLIANLIPWIQESIRQPTSSEVCLYLSTSPSIEFFNNLSNTSIRGTWRACYQSSTADEHHFGPAQIPSLEFVVLYMTALDRREGLRVSSLVESLCRLGGRFADSGETQHHLHQGLTESDAPIVKHWAWYASALLVHLRSVGQTCEFKLCVRAHQVGQRIQ